MRPRRLEGHELSLRDADMIRRIDAHCQHVVPARLEHARRLMAEAGVEFPLIHASAEAVPLLPGAVGYAERGFLAGGLSRNRNYLEGLARNGRLGLRIAEGVPTGLLGLALTAQYLLFALAATYGLTSWYAAKKFWYELIILIVVLVSRVSGPAAPATGAAPPGMGGAASSSSVVSAPDSGGTGCR